MASGRFCCLPGQLAYNALLRRCISTTTRKDLFWERDPKSGYGKKVKVDKQLIVDGFKGLKSEFQLFKSELKELWEQDPMVVGEPGFENVLWNFKSPKDLSIWETTADSDHQQGFSKCEFSISPGGHGLFSGHLSSDVPKDGMIKRAGYCTIRTHRARKSFKRDSYWDWSQYSHLVVRCRGDGRPYMMNIHTMGYFDQLWNDVYHYPLYTRGGPYWQVTRIPFSKFFMSSKGRIQDLQSQVDLEKVSHFGFTATGGADGSFNLEIDYIALLYDPSANENFAYENYRLPKGIAAT